MNNNECSLRTGKCKPCEGSVTTFTRSESEKWLEKVHKDWELTNEASTICRHFSFNGFNRTMGFANAIAWIANQEMHHPDMAIGYNYCTVSLTTHAIQGLSENDFIMAAKIDALVE